MFKRELFITTHILDQNGNVAQFTHIIEIPRFGDPKPKTSGTFFIDKEGKRYNVEVSVGYPMATFDAEGNKI